MNTRCFTLDITDRRQIEETRSRLAAIVEGSQDAIIGKTLDGEILSWNAGAERLLGYSAEEVIGQSIDIVVPADRIDQERHVMEHIRRGQRVEELETVRVARGGTKIDVSLTVSPIRDVDGRLIGASSIARDITARKRAEQTTRFLADASAALFELTDHEAALRRVAELAVPSFADWCIVDLLNDDGGARRLATVHSDSGLVQLADEIHRRYPIHSADMIGVVQVLRSGISEWSPRIGEPLLREIAVDDDHLRVLRELKLHSYISTPLRSRGRILGVVTFMTAESGREYTETDLALAEDLASRAGIAIENAALLAALREADRRKDEFLAMLAHELRNPLAPIRNAAQIIRLKGPPAPEMQWAREVIDRQVDQLNRLVDDLLDVSRITRGKIELRRARISLEDVINTAVEASRPLIEKWGHELVVDLPPDPIHLDADLARLAQAFLNLLNNAAKYTEQRGRISLTAGIENGQAVVRVADNGLGIPPEMLPRIFDMFTQVDRSRERSQDGLGIGLTLVRLIVGLHQGTVHAHSKGIGFGSEFVVRLPLAGAAASEDAAAPTQPAATALPERRILVVDDNADAADTLTRLLRMSGSEVLAVHDGLSAVGAASVFRPDVVLMDIGLPRLNGYEAARRIRQELGDDVLLIAVTGWGQGDDRRKSEEAGFDFHVTKPVSLDELRSLLAAADT
jgi:PAS domain S-box-containing protein